MKPAPFEYHAPTSLDEAVALMSTLDNAKAIAGGQSLVAMMNFRYAMPDHLIDLGNVAGLSGLHFDAQTLRIGSMTRQRELEFSAALANKVPLLKAALAHVGHRQTRNRGTLGGSLAHADPAAELPTVCLVLDAEIEIAGANGTRIVPMREFTAGFMTTALGYDEILLAVHIRPWREGHGYSFQEYARRHGDFAVAGAAVLLDANNDGVIERAAVALCGVTDRPIRRDEAEAALVGRHLDDSVIARAASLAGDVEATADIHADATYRRHLARVLTTRALHEASSRMKTRKRETA
jgi:aerobic carbon-monoxide dehydrogenase medium subunit